MRSLAVIDFAPDINSSSGLRCRSDVLMMENDLIRKPNKGNDHPAGDAEFPTWASGDLVPPTRLIRSFTGTLGVLCGAVSGANKSR